MTTSNNNSNDVYTAVAVEQTRNEKAESLGEPLLPPNESAEVNLTDAGALNSSFRFHGLVIGFLAQVINVTGTTYMYYRWESPNSSSAVASDDSEWMAIMDSFLHSFIWFITQIDLYLYIAMWVSLTAVLTRTGMDYVRNNFFLSEGGQSPSKRSIFVLGVHFYVGVVLGVFLAWTGIDLLLGLPVPVMPMIGVLVFGLLISYTMVWCYDLEDNEDEEEDNTEKQEFVAV